MAGVGKLIAIDPDKMRYSNVGRHPLGANHVGEKKAQALVEHLRKSYPHSEFEFRNVDWRSALADEPNLFDEATLIIAMTGDWSADDALNTWNLERRMPVVFGWMEAHAAAGHAVAIIPTGDTGCLTYGFSDTGKTLFRVTEWPSQTLEQEPACGALYQPYGPAELGYTVNLVTELGLDVILHENVESAHRMWACRLPVLLANGGKWTREWEALKDSRQEGGCVSARPWPRRTDCASCVEAA